MAETHADGILAELNGATVNGSHDRTAKAHAKPPRWWGMLCGFVGNHLSRVSPPAACVWLVMFRFSDQGVVTIGMQQIAEHCGISERYVQTCIKELVQAELLFRLSKGNRRKGCSRYRLLSTGTTVPLVGASIGGTPVPVEESTAGTPVPSATGTPVPSSHERTVPPSPLVAAGRLNGHANGRGHA